MLCLTALANSSCVAPLIVISVIRFEISPICLPVFFMSLALPLEISSSEYAYDILGSNPSSPLRGGVEVIFTLPDLSCVGIHITVSPSKSAPDKRSATLLLIPTASVMSLPRSFTAVCCLLLTVNIGISNVPPCG